MSMPQVCSGAVLQCSYGAAPATLNVLPLNRTLVYTKPHGILNEIYFKRCPVCSLPLDLLTDLPMGAPRPPKPEDTIWVDRD
jgi:hypothetical protein